MALADFQAGFWRVVISRAECVVTLEELPADLRARVDGALATFYGNNATSIESASGITGLKMNGVAVGSAFQAGFQFGLVAQRVKTTTRTNEWGGQLANRITTTAATRDRIRIRRDGGGTLVVEEVA